MRWKVEGAFSTIKQILREGYRRRPERGFFGNYR